MQIGLAGSVEEPGGGGMGRLLDHGLGVDMERGRMEVVLGRTDQRR